MAKVFLTLNSRARAKNNPSTIKLLESNNIPYEKAGTIIYLISKESNKSSVDIISREYNKPYSKFCMQLSDSTPGSIGMGEDILEKKILSILYKVFSDTLYFKLTLSCNSDVENKTAKIIFNAKNKSYDIEVEIDQESDLATEKIEYNDCDRCGNSYAINSECECSQNSTKIIEPPIKFKIEIDKIRDVCSQMEKKDISYTDWAEFFKSKGYNTKININLEILLSKAKFIISNKKNKLPLEINFIEGKFAGWLVKK